MIEYAWLIYALGAALFAGMIPVFAKGGMKKTDAALATGLCSGVVMACAWFAVYRAGGDLKIWKVGTTPLLYLVLSGAAKGAALLCLFKALQAGRVNLVSPLMKLQLVIVLLLEMLLWCEQITGNTLVALVLIVSGILMMVVRKGLLKGSGGYGWILYALLSIGFSIAESLISRLGFGGMDGMTAIAVQYTIMFVMASIVVCIMHNQKQFRYITFASGVLLLLAGGCIVASYLMGVKAMALGPYAMISAINKMSILVTIVLSSVFLKEQLGKMAFAGLILLTVGMILF